MSIDIQEYYHVEPPAGSDAETLNAYAALNQHLLDISRRLENFTGKATQAETVTGTSTQLLLTPYALQGMMKDEDDMSSNSATHWASQQSIVAYVDNYKWFANCYYPEYSAADQGAADTTYDSVKDLVDAIGTSEEATLVFRHDSGGNTTTYTFSTAETIPANIQCIFEQGVRVSGSSNITFAHEDPIIAPRINIFDDQVNNIPYAHVEWFGADPSGASDSRSAFDRAHDSLRNEGVSYALGEDYDLTGTTALTITNGKSFIGKGSESTRLTCTTNAMNIFSIEGQYTTLRGFSINSENTPTSGTAIYLGNTGTKGHSTIIEDVQLNRPYRGIHLDITPDAVTIKDVTILDYVEHAIHVNGSGATICSDCYMDHVLCNQGGSTAGSVGLYLYDAVEAIIVESSSFLQGQYGLYSDGAAYTYRQIPGFNRFTDCYFDSNAEEGAYLGKMNDSQFTSCRFASGNSGAGFDGANIVQGAGNGFVNCVFNNCGSHGIVIQNSAEYTRIVGCEAVGNSVTKGANVSHGIAVAANAQDFTIVGNNCYNVAGFFGTQGYGISLTGGGTADNFIITNNDCTGNGTGGISIGTNYGATTTKIIVHNTPQPTNSKGHLGTWSALASGSRSTSGNITAGTATADGFITAYIYQGNDPTVGTISIQTPTGTTRAWDGFDYNTGQNDDNGYASVTSPVRGGDTYTVACTCGGAPQTINYRVYWTPLH